MIAMIRENLLWKLKLGGFSSTLEIPQRDVFLGDPHVRVRPVLLPLPGKDGNLGKEMLFKSWHFKQKLVMI